MLKCEKLKPKDINTGITVNIMKNIIKGAINRYPTKDFHLFFICSLKDCH